MNYEKLKDKYTDKELAESFVFRNNLTPSQKAESDLQMNAMRKEMLSSASSNQVLLSRLFLLKYQIEDYLENSLYDAERSFGFFLRAYFKSLNKKHKDFADDIDINETELSQILNKRRNPSEKVIIRLEIHSNKIISAITWFKLLEKKKEHEILTDNSLRIKEQKHVRNILKVS